MDVNLFEEIRKDVTRLWLAIDMSEQNKFLKNIFDDIGYLEHRVKDLEKELKTKNRRLAELEVNSKKIEVAE